LKNKEGQTDSWYIDLKEKGEVTKGEPAKADGVFPMDSYEVSGSLQPYAQRRILAYNEG